MLTFTKDSRSCLSTRRGPRFTNQGVEVPAGTSLFQGEKHRYGVDPPTEGTGKFFFGVRDKCGRWRPGQLARKGARHFKVLKGNEENRVW